MTYFKLPLPHLTISTSKDVTSKMEPAASAQVAALTNEVVKQKIVHKYLVVETAPVSATKGGAVTHHEGSVDTIALSNAGHLAEDVRNILKACGTPEAYEITHWIGREKDVNDGLPSAFVLIKFTARNNSVRVSVPLIAIASCKNSDFWRHLVELEVLKACLRGLDS